MANKLRSLRPLVRTVAPRVRMPARQYDPVYDPIYNTLQYRAWRKLVVQRAGYRCEAVDERGHRCTKAHPEHRVYADHIVELRDGGSLLDLNNGRAVCASHHVLKTVKERVKRMAR